MNTKNNHYQEYTEMYRIKNYCCSPYFLKSRIPFISYFLSAASSYLIRHFYSFIEAIYQISLRRKYLKTNLLH